MSSRSAEIILTNTSGADVSLHLEPWGDVVPFPNKSRYRIIAEAAIEGKLEIEYGKSLIIVWGWPSSVLLVFSGDNLISEQSHPVPGLPPGMSTSSFLGMVLGESEQED